MPERDALQLNLLADEAGELLTIAEAARRVRCCAGQSDRVQSP